MKVTIINPPLVSQKNDPHTGIIFMPFMMAYLSSFLKSCGVDVQVIDAFGEKIFNFRYEGGGKQVQGMELDEIVDLIDTDAEVVFIHFLGVVVYQEIEKILKKIRSRRGELRCVLFENSQAVTAFSIKNDAQKLIDLGFDALLYGEPELTAKKLLDCYEKNEVLPQEDGYIFRKENGELFVGKNILLIKNLDELPLPDWGAFPIKNYWSIGYAHGPFEGPYLPIITSRGCPLACRFCVVPSMNNRIWRKRSPENVVDEMEVFLNKFGVREFHIEDVNATPSDRRIREICEKIIQRNLKLNFKFVSGTKIEDIKIETISLLARAGCSYISFSPETGSERLLEKMNKKFDFELALKMVAEMHRCGIKSQACFILGFPEETDEDRLLTRDYMIRLTRVGLDEIAQFIVTPIPGTAIFSAFSGYENYSELTFSPKWRKDYDELHRVRINNYRLFFFNKLLFYPSQVLLMSWNIVRGRFRTKMEQALFRVTLWRIFRKRWL